MTKKSIDISKSVVEQIKKKHITMRPKSYFVLGSIMFSLGISAVFLFSMLFLNLFIFKYKNLSYQFPLYPSIFHPRLIFSNLPFYAIILSFTLLVIGIAFLKRSNTAYKFNPLLVIFTTALLVVLSGFLLDKTGFNRHLGPRVLPPLYRHRSSSPQF